MLKEYLKENEIVVEATDDKVTLRHGDDVRVAANYGPVNRFLTRNSVFLEVRNGKVVIANATEAISWATGRVVK